MKLKATVFMIYFPVTFTLAMINIWMKTIPNPNMSKTEQEDYTKEEIEGINAAKQSIKEFTHGLMGHLKNLTDYLQQVIDEKPLLINFNLIRESDEFVEFKEVFAKTKHTGLNPLLAEEFFLQTFEKIQESFTKTIQLTLQQLQVKIKQIQVDIFKKM